MSTEEINDVQDAARALLQSQMQDRLAVVDRLIAIQEKERELDQELANVRQRWSADWGEAIRLGWTEQDLRKLKLRTPPDLGTKPTRRGKGAARGGSRQPQSAAPPSDPSSSTDGSPSSSAPRSSPPSQAAVPPAPGAPSSAP